MTDREFVEQHWGNSDLKTRDGGEWYFFTANALHRAFFADTRDELWAKGAAFTRQRLEQIAEVEEEIKVLRGYDADNSCHSACCMDRTLGRLESILADLKRGMK